MLANSSMESIIIRRDYTAMRNDIPVRGKSLLRSGRASIRERNLWTSGLVGRR